MLEHLLEISTEQLQIFPKPTVWNKIQVCTQKLDEPVHDNYNWFQVVFKVNSDLSLDFESTQVAFNSMFINVSNWEFLL